MSRGSMEEYKKAASSVLDSDDALITVLQALHQSMGGILLDEIDQEEEGVISLYEILGRDKTPVSRKLAQHALDCSDDFYFELEEYRKNRTDWLNEQATQTDELMQSVEMRGASMLYLVNACHALWEEECALHLMEEPEVKAIHALIEKTPVAGYLASLKGFPALEPEKIRRLGCLVGIISYITLKTQHYPCEKRIMDFSKTPCDLPLDVMIFWAAALTLSRCGRQDAQDMQDIAVIALCMVLSYSHASTWEGQKMAMDCLSDLTAADHYILGVLTDGKMKEKMLDICRSNEQIQAMMHELLAALGSFGDAQQPAEEIELTSERERAWHDLRAGLLKKAQTAFDRQRTKQQEEEYDMLRRREREHGKDLVQD